MRLSEMQDLLNETLRTAGAEEAALAVRLFLEERLHLAPLTIPLYRDMEVGADGGGGGIAREGVEGFGEVWPGGDEGAVEE